MATEPVSNANPGAGQVNQAQQGQPTDNDIQQMAELFAMNFILMPLLKELPGAPLNQEDKDA